MMLHLSRALLTTLFILSSVTAIGQEKNDALKIKFLPQWSTQAQFAGYYVAKEKGFYDEYGLDVEIIDGGPDKSAPEFLKSRKADIVTLFLASGIRERASGCNLVNIAQMSKRSSLVFIAKRSRGILTLGDMQGKKLGLWRSDFQDVPFAFIKKYKLDMAVVTVSGTVNLFLWDGVDVMTVMWYNEYHTIINSGINPYELSAFFFFDHDINVPEDGLYCLKDSYDKNPDAYRNFVRASIKGWEYAFVNPDEAIDIIIKKMNDRHLPANKAHQKWMLRRIKDLYFDSKSKGKLEVKLDEKAYRETVEILEQARTITSASDYKEFYLPLNGDGNAKK